MKRFPHEQWERLVSDHRRALAEPEHYVTAFEWPRTGRVVDLGCGPGFFTAALLDACGAEVVGVDVQPQMLEVLHARLGTPSRLTTAVADLTHVPFERGTFDAAWCAFVFHELDDMVAVSREIRRLLVPGGRVVVLEWEPGRLDHGPPEDERVAPDEIEAALSGAGFKVSPPLAITAQQYSLVGQVEDQRGAA